MKLASLAISVVAHVVLVGSLWLASRPLVVQEPAKPDEPLFFELIEGDEALSESVAATAVCPREAVGGSSRETQVDQGASPQLVDAMQEDRLEVPDVRQVIAKAVEDGPRETVEDRPRQTQEQAGDSSRGADADEMAKSAAEETTSARLMAAPVALNRIQPHYPKSARRRNREGCVTVEFSVAADGKVESAAVVASSGYSELDASALDSVRKAQFAPATEDGEPVAATLRLTLEFRLK